MYMFVYKLIIVHVHVHDPFGLTSVAAVLKRRTIQYFICVVVSVGQRARCERRRFIYIRIMEACLLIDTSTLYLLSGLLEYLLS